MEKLTTLIYSAILCFFLFASVESAASAVDRVSIKSLSPSEIGAFETPLGDD
jgi:hypothetical protein